MANTVEIIVQATDKASSVLTGIVDKLGPIGIQLGQQVFDFYEKALKETMDFAEEVRTVKNLIGLSPEEASRLINLAETVGITFSELQSVMSGGLQRGTDMSIENLQRLAQEYNNLQDPIEQSTFLLQNFGARGLEIGPLFSSMAGGVGLFNDELDRYGRILTEETLAKTEELRLAQIGLKQSVDELQMALSVDLIPTLTTMIAPLTIVVNAYNDLKELLNNLPPVLKVAALNFDMMLNPIKALVGPIYYVVDALRQLIELIKNMPPLPDWFGGTGTGTGTGTGAGTGNRGSRPRARAYGGVVAGNYAYPVGERGPELFVPQTSGRIVPNSQLGGGGMEIDYVRLGDEIVGAMMRSGYVR